MNGHVIEKQGDTVCQESVLAIIDSSQPEKIILTSHGAKKIGSIESTKILSKPFLLTQISIFN